MSSKIALASCIYSSNLCSNAGSNPYPSFMSCGYDVAMPPYDSWGGIATS